MKIAVIDTGSDAAPAAEARAFLAKLIEGLLEKGHEIHLIAGQMSAGNFRESGAGGANFHLTLRDAGEAAESETASAAAELNALDPDVYLIWTSNAIGWTVLPLLDPSIATLAVGHADSEIFYAPVRHYRPFLTRVVGTTPETCVGFVLGCVLDKERIEWISMDELEGRAAGSAEEEMQKIVETYENCCEKAVADARAAPRQRMPDFPPLRTSRPAAQSWFGKLKAKILN